jgi:hypothetical protein
MLCVCVCVCVCVFVCVCVQCCFSQQPRRANRLPPMIPTSNIQVCPHLPVCTLTHARTHTNRTSSHTLLSCCLLSHKHTHIAPPFPRSPPGLGPYYLCRAGQMLCAHLIHLIWPLVGLPERQVGVCVIVCVCLGKICPDTLS